MLIDMFSRGKLCSLLVGLRSVKSLLSVSEESLYLVFEFVAAAYMLRSYLFTCYLLHKS